MALQKDTVLTIGTVANYYRITNITISKTSMDVSLGLYVSKATRDIGYDCINCSNYSFNINLSTFDTVNPYVYAYTILKELDEFDGALDV